MRKLADKRRLCEQGNADPGEHTWPDRLHTVGGEVTAHSHLEMTLLPDERPIRCLLETSINETIMTGELGGL